MADQVSDPAPEAHEVPAQRDARVELIEDDVERATVRRAPKIVVFLVAGAALGILVALILTYAFGVVDESGVEGSAFSAVTYTKGQIFGFLALICVAAGVTLGGIVALILDRTIGRRTHRVEIDRETVTTAD